MTSLHVAAVLVFLLGLAHSVRGDRFILVRLFRRNDLPKLFGGTRFTTRTLRFAWHITTVAWWGMAAILWLAGSGDLTERSTLAVIGGSFLTAGLLPLVITRGRHLSWLVLFLVGGIALLRAAV